MNNIQMKTINYRGGVLKFRIPSSWKEEYSDWDGGMFYEDVPNSGTLRVRVVTLRGLTNADDSAFSVLQPLLKGTGKSRVEVVEIGRNTLVRYEESALEEGTKLRIFYWVFGNPVPPGHARVVTFSYTVLETQAATDQTRQEFEMLDASLLKTEFAERIGAVAE
jgi:hypothetical protein